MRAALDVHERTIVCASQPDDPRAGELRVQEIPNTECAIRALVRRLGGAAGLVVCYGAGPCGYDLLRLLSEIGVACDIVAPALTPRAPGARVKTDRRDAKRLLVLHRAGALKFVHPPTPEQEGLRDLVRCRDDLVCARRAARHRVGEQLLRHGHVFREAHSAFEHMLCHLDSVDAQIAALDHELDQIAAREPWSDPVRWLCCFRGITTLTALGLLAELGDLRRLASARELMSFLGLTPSEYSSGDQRHRGHITKSGPRHARRLLDRAMCTRSATLVVADSGSVRPLERVPRRSVTNGQSSSTSIAAWTARPPPPPRSTARRCSAGCCRAARRRC